MQSVPAILAKEFYESFQQLLLRVSQAASSGLEESALIELFCQSTREFFQVSGAYFWHIEGVGELVCTAASGVLEAEFRERRLRAPTPSIALDAVRSRRTVVVNYLDQDKYPLAAEAGTRAIMAAPLVVCNEVIGALAFVHSSDPGFFNDDMGARPPSWLAS
jgi:GAF domain-containing protein